MIDWFQDTIAWIASMEMCDWLQGAFLTITVLLMAAALVGILLRLVAVLRGKDSEALLPEQTVTWRALCIAAGVALLSRVLLYVWSWLAMCWQLGGWQPIFGHLPRLWVQWDAYHYLALADNWYVNEGNNRLMLVFFPLFPALVRGLKVVLGDAFWSSIALNLCLTAGATSLLYALVGERYGRAKAWLAVAYFLLNPLSVFLGAPYSEALFLCTTLAALYACAHRKYGWAALFGALSALSRMLGLVVCGVIALTAAQHVWREQTGWRARAKKMIVPLLCAAAVGLGFAAYLWLNVSVSGAPFTFLEYQRTNWSQQFGSFWNTVRTTVDYALRYWGEQELYFTWLPQLISMVLVMALIALRQKRLPLPWAAYSWVYVYIALAPTWLLSGPRYLMAMATLPILQAVLTDRKWVHAVSLAVQGALLLYGTYVYAVLRQLL